MKIAILGIGIMGSIMSEAVLRAGYDLIVYNRTIEKTKPFADKGAVVAETPAQAIREADVSIIVVMGGDAVKEIMLNPDTFAVVKGKTIICASSCRLDEMMAVDAAIIEYGGRFAEITMGSTSANHSVENLYFELGCPVEDEVFLVETLSPMCEKVQRFGEVGYLANTHMFEAKMAQIQKDITEKKHNSDKKTKISSKVFTAVVSKMPNYEKWPEKFKVDEKCNLCGTCGKVCPMGNIEIEDKVKYGNSCVGCLACYHNCPKSAIGFKGSRGTARWRNPDVTLKEIIIANEQNNRRAIL